MANLPQNVTYQRASAPPNSQYSQKYNLPYALAEFRRRSLEGSPLVVPGALPSDYPSLQNIEAGLKYSGQQASIGTPLASFNKTQGDIDIPSNYSGFKPAGSIPGTSLEWQDPTQPKIRSVSGGDLPSQMVVDINDQDALIKSYRGRTSLERAAILGDRPSSLYRVDHILPLELGGADTDANQQVLDKVTHVKKTKAQAVPYTLYRNGDISLNAARNMALFWQNKDLTDIPFPDDNGLVPLDIAKEAAERWGKPNKVTIKDVIANIPEAAKN